MKNISRLFLSALILCSILAMCACASEPEIEIEADFIIVGFEDHTTIELTKGSPQFKQISDEAIRICQGVDSGIEELVLPQVIEEIKYNNKFVEIGFIEPVSVTTSFWIPYDDGYRTFKLTSALVVFTGEYAWHILPGPKPDFEFWGVWDSQRSFGNLEKMVDALAG